MYRTSTADESIIIHKWKPLWLDHIRYYIPDWHKLVGFRYETYKTGNVWWATLDGESLANNRANEFKQTKVWLDEEHNIHIDHLTPRVPITQEQMHTRIHKALEERGLFQIN